MGGSSSDMLSFDDSAGFYAFRDDCIQEAKKLFKTYGFAVADCYKAIETEIAPWNNWYMNPNNRQILGKNFGSSAVGLELKDYCLKLVIHGMKRHYNDIIIEKPIAYYTFKFRKGQRDVLISDIDIESDSLEACTVDSVMAKEVKENITSFKKDKEEVDYADVFGNSLIQDNQKISEFIDKMNASYANQHLTRPLVELLAFTVYHVEIDCPKRVL